jgi:hypothetical protein
LVVAAQEGETASTPPVAGKEARTGPVELGRIFLPDVDGVLVPVVTTSYEEFLRERDLAKGYGGESGMHEFEIRSLDITGVAITTRDEGPNTKESGEPSPGPKRKATTDRVDLSVKLKIAVETDTEEPIGIPLGFGQAALRTTPGDVNAGGPWVGLDKASENDEGATTARSGYMLWLQGRGKGTIEEVALEFSVPLTGLGGEHGMLLSVPKATKSELRLTVPMANAAAETSQGTILDTEANGEDTTDLILHNFRGEIDLTWRHPKENAEEAAPVLISRGEITATVARNVVFEAELSVTGDSPSGRELTKFEVRLPPGAVLLEEQNPNTNYTVSYVPSTNQLPHLGRLVEVAFSKPVRNTEPAVVTLRATSDVAANGQFPLAGFGVSRATRQTGWVEIRTLGDWDVHVDPGRGVQQISKFSEGQDSEGVLAHFEYFEQPFTLAARAFPKRERISVEPRYDLSIESDTARLAATLKYAVRGNNAYQLMIEPNGWEFDRDRVGPEQLVKACEIDDSGTLVIRLEEGMMDEFELSLTAHRPIDSAESSLELPLPKPVATSLSPAALIVLPADNIDLREDREKTVGLERQKVPPPASLAFPEIQQQPLYYRGKTDRTETEDMGEARFSATVRVRQQEITAELSTEIDITSARASVKETLAYDVKYEPTSHLTIQVPLDLAVEYSLDGEAVAAVATDETADAAGLVLRKLLLPSPRQGRFELTAEYTVLIGDLPPKTSVPCAIALIAPANVALTGHRVRATIAEGIGIWCREGPWQEVSNGRTSYNSATIAEFTTDTPETRIEIGVQQKDPDSSGTAVVHLAWIQTWLNDSQRHDRAVYRFVSDRRHLVVSLPEGEGTDLLEVQIDGQDAKYELTDRRVSVDLTPEQPPRPHVLELRYISESRPARGGMQLELPRLPKEVWVRRCYWQLVLPGNEHVVSAPRDYTAEYEWAWNGVWWGRVPVKEQADLENWVGAVREAPVPKGTSRYLFSKFGPAETVQLATASRTWIVGGASSLALLTGLLLIYFPGTRHPLAGVVLAVVVAGMAVVWPGAALLCAQAAGMGLGLSLLGAILYRGVARRRRRTAPRELPSSVLERGSTQAQFGSSEVELLRSTATEPGAATVHAPER